MRRVGATNDDDNLAQFGCRAWSSHPTTDEVFPARACAAVRYTNNLPDEALARNPDLFHPRTAAANIQAQLTGESGEASKKNSAVCIMGQMQPGLHLSPPARASSGRRPAVKALQALNTAEERAVPPSPARLPDARDHPPQHRRVWRQAGGPGSYRKCCPVHLGHAFTPRLIEARAFGHQRRPPRHRPSAHPAHHGEPHSNPRTITTITASAADRGQLDPPREYYFEPGVVSVGVFQKGHQELHLSLPAFTWSAACRQRLQRRPRRLHPHDST